MKGSGSSAALLLACGYSFRDDVSVPDEPAGDAAEYGTKLHKLLEDCANNFGRHLNISDVSPDLIAGQDWIEEHNAYAVNGWLIEQPLAFDVITGKVRALPKQATRDLTYAQRTDTELPGTIDLLSPAGVVYDWTTAMAPAYKWPQLRLYTMMASRWRPVADPPEDRERGVILRIRDGLLTEESRMFTPAELDAAAREVQFHAAMIHGSKPRPGRHCTEMYCKARSVCPAIQAVTSQAAELVKPGAPHKLSLTIDGPEHAAWMLSAVDHVDDALVTIKKRLRAYADSNGGIPVEGGIWSGKNQTRETIEVDGDNFHKGLSALEDIDHAEVLSAIEVKHSLTWAALDKAMGKAQTRDLKEKLREAGALKTNTFPVYEVRKAK